MGDTRTHSTEQAVWVTPSQRGWRMCTLCLRSRESVAGGGAGPGVLSEHRSACHGSTPPLGNEAQTGNSWPLHSVGFVSLFEGNFKLKYIWRGKTCFSIRQSKTPGKGTRSPCYLDQDLRKCSLPRRGLWNKLFLSPGWLRPQWLLREQMNKAWGLGEPLGLRKFASLNRAPSSSLNHSGSLSLKPISP